MTAIPDNKAFNEFTYEQKRLVRVGYIRLNSKAVSEQDYQALTSDDLRRYYEYGSRKEKKSKQITIVIWGIIILVAAVWFGLHYYQSKKQATILNDHYNSIAPVDICSSSLKALQLFSTDIDLYGVLPTSPTTKYTSNQTSTCNYFVKGSGPSYNYVDFVTATVTKSKTKQNDNTHQQDATLLTDTPYKVFAFNGQANYYSISVSGGIDPKQTTMSPEQSDNLSKLIVLLFGTGIAKDIPQNPGVGDVQ